MDFPIRVDLTPVNFYGSFLSKPISFNLLKDPYLTAPYGMPMPLATVPQMGTKFTPDMSLAQRIENGISWLVQFYLRYGVVEPILEPLRQKFGITTGHYESFQKVIIESVDPGLIFTGEHCDVSN